MSARLELTEEQLEALLERAADRAVAKLRQPPTVRRSAPRAEPTLEGRAKALNALRKAGVLV